MRRFIVRRLVQSVLLLWVLVTFTFVLVRLTPGGPESALLQQPNVDGGLIGGASLHADQFLAIVRAALPGG